MLPWRSIFNINIKIFPLTIPCVVIDDEPIARKGLIEYIGEIDFLELRGAFDNPVMARQAVEELPAPLLFLDIQMPRITGLDFMKVLERRPPVIFTTAFAEFAVEGFELNALDYLVKPIAFDRFMKAALKAKDYFFLHQEGPGITRQPEDYFFIKADNKLFRIPFSEILFIEALQNYVVVHTRQRKYITYLTFRAVEEFLPSRLFIRTHKSYIISAAMVDSIEGNDIRIGQHFIPVSRNLREEVMDRLLNGRFLKR